MDKMVVDFGDGDRTQSDLLGSKGANLSEMTRIGIPVPPGFTITTEVCAHYQDQHSAPEGLWAGVDEAITRLEVKTGKRFGAADNLLLVSVRSGAAVSMPGMMDSILNLGLNRQNLTGLATGSADRRFALDSYRRLIQMFGDVVNDIPNEEYERILVAKRQAAGVVEDHQIPAEKLEELVGEYEALYKERVGSDFPQDPRSQLRQAIEAVFRSWDNPRAIKYRQINSITGPIGTAATVQTMVFGNRGPTSGTGVYFTRDPTTGERSPYGEFLVNAQGEDVVAGTRTPNPLAELIQDMPKNYQDLMEVLDKLEKHLGDMQDIEFTIEEGTTYILQTRDGKRTAKAALRIAVEMVGEGLIDEQQAVLRFSAEQLGRLLHPQFDPDHPREVLLQGMAASPGAACGQVVFTASEAEAQVAAGNRVILVREDTSPDDIGGMAVAEAILTSRGGRTSHAAVVARGMGIACIVGCGELDIDPVTKLFRAGEVVVKEGDELSLDGTSGEVYLGTIPTIEQEPDEHFTTIMGWADAHRRMRVRANCDTPADATHARTLGAEGIGLCRTEHMFFEGHRIVAMREMILARNHQEREVALAKLLPLQQADFEGIFRAMAGLPVTIRLLDPPLHEFLPQELSAQEEVARDLGIDQNTVAELVNRLRELNPMLGHRGCRLGITHPEIYAMQVRAIARAAINIDKEGIVVVPEIMIPLIGTSSELAFLRDRAEKVWAAEEQAAGVKVPRLIGTMIEIPRACVDASQVAKVADFFSFGTNDLTQMTFGYSRDDAGTFLPAYIDKGILVDDPFQSIDVFGVGGLVHLALSRGRAVKPDLKIGVCGEHGGDPASIRFFDDVGLDYVSCSPFRIPIARLVAAQATISKLRGTNVPTHTGLGRSDRSISIDTP